MISALRFCFIKVACSRPKSYMVREARMLQKMMMKSSKKPQILKHSIISKNSVFPHDNENCSSRLSALNKIYMERITEILHSGECAQQLGDLEIEVTKVKLSKGYNFLNIYFVSKDINVSNNVLRETLSGVLAQLQARIGEFSPFVRVPYLKFVRDGMLENARHLEKFFQVMDFGKDFQPVYNEKVITPYSSTKKDSLLEMRQNVFGVNVDKIKEDIAAKILRFKAINTETSEEDLYSESNYSQKLIEFNKKEFFKFLKRKRIAEIKRRKIAHRERDALGNDFNYEPDNIFENKYQYEGDECGDKDMW